MQAQCVIALYPSRSDAQLAYQAVIDAGVADDHVRMSNSDGYLPHETRGRPSIGSEPATGGMWDWLFGSAVPEGDQRMYDSRMSSGQTAVSVLIDDAPSVANTEMVEDILEDYSPLDLHTENEGFGAQSPSAPLASDTGEKERVIPLPEEELKVGKRATERVRHVRTYVVEEPVEEDVTLHDERTIIEKRPATGSAAAEPAEREYEIRERHEEPVVEKRTRAGDELVVRKESAERTEKVRDTVRKTKADVEGKR